MEWLDDVHATMGQTKIPYETIWDGIMSAPGHDGMENVNHGTWLDIIMSAPGHDGMDHVNHGTWWDGIMSAMGYNGMELIYGIHIWNTPKPHLNVMTIEREGKALPPALHNISMVQTKYHTAVLQADYTSPPPCQAAQSRQHEHGSVCGISNLHQFLLSILVCDCCSCCCSFKQRQSQAPFRCSRGACLESPF